ncbi:hypothetical protein CHLRE_01g028850v5 [Chlamydomonas reinhardtii]|jgi:rhodanese-related sulfurtransferase|uniref:Uncharacterized protein n=1 Tax=Chlamydomonas reinhardtii TaxID=3055 RepID=A8HQC6_CHLRE|nr:uncharacterized protein CHLRE_01g028850v5 [Chlamydomonas reinhardtii]PNW88424.1 hypothetical protein CHLRE_01g028850v5 [Chlamydomonas reinhardtii]|eukprot:XP_001690030.1 predicted protein [Chlamydomonas reinhardtii]
MVLSRKAFLTVAVVALLLCAGCAEAGKKKKPSAGGRKPARKPKPSNGNKPSKRAPDVLTVSAADALALLDGKNTTFLDIRTEANFTASHIAGAVNIPKALVRQAINSGKPKPPPATKNILCYSAPAAGAKPSTATDEAIATCLYFKTSGKYPDIKLYALAGGFPLWTAAGYATAAN